MSKTSTLNHSGRLLLFALLALPLAAAAWFGMARADDARLLPPPAVDEHVPATVTGETAVLAGGCFWGMQGVFEHVKGVKLVLSGYSGGTVANPGYEQVSSGTTGHAESIEIKYDPSQVTYGTLLQIYFSVAHNPTELNYQGPDQGTQYRSAVFYSTEEQKQLAEAYIAQLNAAGVYPAKIVTEVTAFTAFYAAEDYHQDYLIHHPDSMYIAFNDLPKVENLKAMFPQLYLDQPVMVSSN